MLDPNTDGTLKAINAIDQAPATGDGKPNTITCPACGTGKLRYVKGKHRNRQFIRAACDTPNCVRIMS